MSRLPPELVRLVLLNFREDASALKQSTLVSKNWTHEAQQLLFGEHFISIDFGRKSQSQTRSTRIRKRSSYGFIEMVDESPHIKALIRAVKLNLVNVAAVPEARYQWTMEEFLSPLLTTRLDKLEKLHIYGPEITSPNVITLPLLSSVDPAMEAAFSSIINLKFVGSINVASSVSLQYFLCSFPRLQDFSFDWLPTVYMDNPEPAPAVSTLALRCLSMHIRLGDDDEDEGALFEWLRQTRTIDTLERLTFVEDWTTPHLDQFISALSRPWSLHLMDGELCKCKYLPSPFAPHTYI
jgi:hypothetical protein